MPFVLRELAQIVSADILSIEGVTRFSPNRRFASLYAEGSPAENMYFLESGLVKTFKRNEESKEIILEIVIPGELFGWQALGPERQCEVSAEILHEGIIHVIPREVILQCCTARPDLWRLLAAALLNAKRQLERKIELLCLHDVEYRILYFVGQLAETIGSVADDHARSIPLSQGELASLIGATRETTSTTLNTLARRGLLRLGRRELTVPSMDVLRATTAERVSKAALGD
jgi:CRP/FNR family cyclic AMP-dependent transcriptional regulator